MFTQIVRAVRLNKIRPLTCKLVIEANELAIVDLLEQVLQFLCLSSALNFVQRPNVVVDVLCVFLDAHIVQCLQTLLLVHSLQCIR